MKMNPTVIRMALPLAAVVLALPGCSTVARSDSYGEYFSEYLSDTTLAYHVKVALLAEPEVNELRTQVATLNGAVQLSGVAANPGQVQKMEQVARGVRGVTSVRSDIALR